MRDYRNWRFKHGGPKKPTPPQDAPINSKQYYVFNNGRMVGQVWAISRDDAQALAVEQFGPDSKIT